MGIIALYGNFIHTHRVVKYSNYEKLILLYPKQYAVTLYPHLQCVTSLSYHCHTFKEDLQYKQLTSCICFLQHQGHFPYTTNAIVPKSCILGFISIYVTSASSKSVTLASNLCFDFIKPL